jgi:hypothetical protein
MNASRWSRHTGWLWLVSLSVLAGCGRMPPGGNPVATPPATTFAAASPGSLAAQARGFPDFTELVAQYGPAVVNISVIE